MKRCSYVLKDDFCSAVIDMKPIIIKRSHMHFDEIMTALRKDHAEEALSLIDTKQKVKEYVQSISDIEIRGNSLFYKNEEMHGALVDQIFKMIDSNENVEPLYNFFLNLHKNPSYRAVNELYEWMESAGITSITPDGHFLAYKKISNDWKDIHSGTFDNSIGSVCSVERNKVDEDAERTCSFGLHFCSYSYLSKFACSPGNRVVILKINPADVVAIPKDYNNAKGRCCRYEVIDEVLDWEENHVLDKPVEKTYMVFKEADEYEISSVIFDSKKDEAFEDFCAKHTNKELADAYRNLTGKGPKEFKSKKEAIARILRDCDVDDFKDELWV